MHIVLIVPGGVDRSGRERVIPALLWLIERLAQRHQVTVIALRQYPKACRYQLLGAQVVNLGDVPAPFSRLETVIRLKRLLSVLNALPEKPHILHAFWAVEPGLLAAIAGKWMSIPLVLSIGGGELVWLPEIGYGGMGRSVGRLKISLSVQLAARITAGSRYSLRMIPRGPTALRWIPLGADTRLFTPPADRPEVPPYRLLQVANLNRVKNQALLLHALSILRRQLSDVQLDLIGGDLLGGKLAQLAEELSIAQAIRLHGHLPSEEILNYYQGAHLYVQTSLHESQGVVVCEAAATGLPSVGTPVGLIPELAPQAALSVGTWDAQDLAHGMESLLRDSKHRQRLGEAAYEWAHTYDADWTAREFEHIYEGLVSSA